MELLIVGASGRTGKHLVEAAVDRGFQVRAMSRSITQRGLPDGASALAGDVLDADTVRAAVDGVSAVLVSLSMVRASDSPWAKILTPLDLHVRAATLLTDACRTAGVNRYVTLSAHGVGPSASRAGWGFLALVRASNIGLAYRNLADAETIIENSGLDWTVIRPTRLTTQPDPGSVIADPALRTTSWSSISRESVARFMVETVTSDQWSRQYVSITGG